MSRIIVCVSLTLFAGCYLNDRFRGAADDMSMSEGGDDMGASDTDMGNDDLAGDPAQPRLIAPLSTSTIARRTPTLRWTLGAGFGQVVVDLCKDRACTQPLSVSANVAADGLTAVPTAALPPGWVFWRVRTVLGSKTATSATWQFWVGKATSGGVDSSSGCTFDVNGDGYADYLVGASGGSGAGAKPGAVHVYLGGATVSATNWNGVGAAGRIDVTNPNTAATGFGATLDCAGDVNGDGYADFVVGSGTAAYVFFGGSAASATDWNGPAAPKRIALADPDGGGISSFGIAVAGLGDVDGDGYSDFLVGNSAVGSYAGTAHLYLGGDAPSSTDWNGTSPAKRIDLTDLDGANAHFGSVVAGAGDVNGDRFADFLIRSNTAAHLYLGHAAPMAGDWNNGTTNRYDLTSPNGTGGFGLVVAPLGDVNADGYADFVITAASGNPPLVYVYLGGSVPNSGWNGAVSSRRIDLTTPTGAPVYYGGAAAKAGDVNGDGFDDFLVGGDGNSPNTAYLYLGLLSPGANDWNATSTPNRFAISTTGTGSGNPFSTAGDVNGDNYADFLIGMDVNSTTGGASLYLGEATPTSSDWTGTSPAKRIDLTSPDGSGAFFGASFASW